MKLIIYTDGASRGNPGEGGIGVVIQTPDGAVLSELSEYLGTCTNNVAEYTALVRALEEGLRLGGTEAEVYTDSELLVKQINGDYRVRNEGLIPLYRRTMELKQEYRYFSINYIPREQNKRADYLANVAIDRGPQL